MSNGSEINKPQRPIIQSPEELINIYFPNIKHENKEIMKRMMIEFGVQVVNKCADRVLEPFTQSRIKGIIDEFAK